jgi:hypothetical protein
VEKHLIFNVFAGKSGGNTLFHSKIPKNGDFGRVHAKRMGKYPIRTVISDPKS